MIKTYTKFFEDSLFRNSLYPMIATAVMAGFGFFFWLFSARLYTTEAVGLAGTLITVMTTIAAFSFIGFDSSTVRFLAKDDNKNATINTGITLISIASVMFSLLFIVFSKSISPQLAIFCSKPFTAFAFIVFTTLTSLNIFTDAIFLAYRSTKFTLYVSIVFSAVKVVLPFAFVSYGVFGIVTAAALAQTLGYIISLTILIRVFDYRPKVQIDRTVVSRVWKYNAGNYLGDIFNFIPIALLPIIVTNILGAEQAAYYYIVTMITGFLYVIPSSAMRALFAEGAFDENSTSKNIRRSLKNTALFLVPAILIFFIAGKYILALFGAEYSDSGLTFLYIMTLASITITAYSLYGALFRLTNNIRALVARNIVQAVGILGLTYFLLPYGLTGIGIAYIGGNILSVTVSYILFRLAKKNK